MSPAPVLVAYASKHSSTAEIAERIAAAMREAGRAAEVRPASEVDDLSGYGAVVLGSAVYAKRWQREASGRPPYQRPAACAITRHPTQELLNSACSTQ